MEELFFKGFIWLFCTSWFNFLATYISGYMIVCIWSVLEGSLKGTELNVNEIATDAIWSWISVFGGLLACLFLLLSFMARRFIYCLCWVFRVKTTGK